MNIIELKNIFLRRESRSILEDLSWTIGSGENWALLGANGSGKTSLLRLIIGDDWPTSGSIKVLGETFGDCNIQQLRTRVGWVSSALEQRLHSWNTALEIVVTGLDGAMDIFHPYTAEQFERARKTLAAVGGDYFAEQDFDTLSQGEQQRLLIARALVIEPAVLILDEPCIGLDPVARGKLLNDLETLSSSPRCPSMIYVTHHIEEIGPWIDRVIILKQGQVLTTGPVEEVLGSADILSEAFGEPCRVEKVNGRYHLHLIPTFSHH